MQISCEQEQNHSLDIQGHRGCRGLYPENTTEGFLHAVSLGVTTLEMDVVISGEGEVIVSHEPFFHADITTKEDGNYILAEEQKKHNIFQMTREEINRFDVGTKPHPKFKLQRKFKAVKPSLDEVFTLFKDHSVRFNIEIKRKPGEDHIFHPEACTFIQLVTGVIRKHDMVSRVCLQSFDTETLQLLHSLYPEFTLAYLTDDHLSTFEQHVNRLGFIPDIFSPHYKIITVPLIRYCHRNGVRIIPWTVNKTIYMRKLIRLGVDGIITDYPDKLIQVIRTVHG